MNKKKKRPTISNISNNQALSIEQIKNHLFKCSGGWPKNVGGILHWPREGQLIPITTVADLFAFIDRHAKVEWHRVGISKEEFLAGLIFEVECFDWHSALPHFPPIPKVLYTHPSIEAARTGALKTLVDCYHPATDIDYALIKTLFLTNFWGGPPGQRPAFCVTAASNVGKKGRGAGKTSLMQHVARLAGGYISYRQNEPESSLIPRLLSPQSLASRVLTLDNLKSRRFASGDIESLITAERISGKRLYCGEASRPNYLTVIITVNGPGFGLDMSDRLIVIQLAERPKAVGWEQKVSALLKDRQEEILADIAYIMSKPPQPVESGSRWSTWEREVLARSCKNPQAVIDRIERRQRRIDIDMHDDRSVIDHLHACIAARVGGDVDVAHVLIPSSCVIGWAKEVHPELGRRATEYIKQLAIPELRWKHKNSGDFFEWRGNRCPEDSTPKKFS